MRSITTNPNNAAFNSSTVFVDGRTGNTLTVGANRAGDVRTMYDSVDSGTYRFDAGTISADPATLSTAPEDSDTVTVTVQINSVDVVGYPVKASSDDTDIATVTPHLGFTKDDGTVTFTVVSVADGEATITFTAGSKTDTTVVTVATP
jgi:hypothetical protein